MSLSKQELATVLAALRFYQSAGQGEPDNRDEAIHEIATDGGDVISLDTSAIDELCARLNTAKTICEGDPRCEQARNGHEYQCRCAELTEQDRRREQENTGGRRMSTPRSYRVRRCNGNKDAWCLIALRDDGTEIDSYGGYKTALSLDALLLNPHAPYPRPQDHITLCL